MMDYTMYYDLIRCIQCIENLLYLDDKYPQDIYNKLTSDIEKRLNIPRVDKLYTLIKPIEKDRGINDYQAISFLNRFLTKHKENISPEDRKFYLKVINPLFVRIHRNSDLSSSEIYAYGDELIEKYKD